MPMTLNTKGLSLLLVTIAGSGIGGPIVAGWMRGPAQEQQVKQLVEEVREINQDSKDARKERAEIRGAINSVQVYMAGNLYSQEDHDVYAKERAVWEREKDLQDARQDAAIDELKRHYNQ